jgi:hypothetical protein
MKKITPYFIAALVLIIAVYDIVAAVKGGNPATISGWFWRNSKQYPMIPFLSGIVAGHLYWGGWKKEDHG